MLSLAWAEMPPDDATPPANPAEFHAQEWQRIRAGLKAYAEFPLTSTETDYDVLYYDLTVDVRNYSAHTILGRLDLTARSVVEDLDELVLDLCSQLTVDSAIVGGEPRLVTRDGHQLTIELDRVYGETEIVNATIYYHGVPCNTNLFPSFIWYNRPVASNIIPTIATLSEPYGARDWWPCKNDPYDKADSMRISIIVADTLTATSNGVLEALTPIEPTSQMFTWFERHPIASYLVSLNATNFASFGDWYVALNGDSMPITHYVYPERYWPAVASWDSLPAMMQFCANLWGEYPFVDEKYGHTMFNVLGGMEHQCNTSYGRGLTNGQHTYDYVVLHELAHQWFGDAVTLATWPDIWLNEGFASYSEALWVERQGGSPALQSYMLNPSQDGVTDPSGPVYDPAELFNSNTVYNKGAWILHILRGVVRNDSLFFGFMREYYNRHRYASATTEAMLSDASEILGFDVAPYLHAYLYRTNRPDYRVSFGSGNVDGVLRTAVRIHQVQTDPDTTFQTRLDLRFGSPGNTLVSVINAERRQRFFFDLGWTPGSLTVDPDNWVLKNVEMEPLAPTVLNTEVADGLASFAYNDSLVAIGGTTPYSWTVVSGTLPPGMALNPAGILIGTTYSVGSFPFSARVSDAVGDADTANFVLNMQTPLTPPQQVSVYRTGATSITLRWRRVMYADSYYVYRATSGDLSDAEHIRTTSNNKMQDDIPPGEPNAIIRRFYYIVAVRNAPQ